MVQQSLRQAREEKAYAVILNMNTYGGEVLYADSIRTAILHSPIPVYVFINNNAASAGALISIACDSIYMHKSATIGASTVVDQTGAAAPDKYQSYMRGIIRATAEAQGKIKVVEKGDTVEKWRRDPHIAEAMVDPDVAIEGVIEKGKVLTLTASEARKYGYCEGIAETIPEIIEKHLGLSQYELQPFKMAPVDKIKGHLMGSALRAILIMIIVAGIWFELQSPGLGFPSLAALVAAVLYFAPLYIDGLAQNWEIIVFILGLILLALEWLVIPGFGVAGILGTLCVMTGLIFALVDNVHFSFTPEGMALLQEPFLLVSLSILVAVIFSIWLSSRIGVKGGFFSKMALTTTQEKENGYLGVPPEISQLVGKTGITATIMKPSGKVLIDGKQYDAMAEFGYLEQGTAVSVTRYEAGQLYVEKI
jgi:membrane-bound serine protease (ClpP class)